MNPQETVKALGLTVQSIPVPTPQPDTKPGEWRLHWRVTVLHNGRPILTTNYSAGCAHAPSYRQGARWTVDYAEIIKSECETMRRYRRFPAPAADILPDPLDVLSCIVSDSSAIDYPCFEDWAANYGFDPDSRKGEAVYRQCLEHGLKLRAAIGEAGLAQLREAFQDY